MARWGNLKVKEIKRRDVRDLLDEIVARGAPIMANRTLALVRKMFNFAIERDWLDSNPWQMIKRPAPDRQRQRVLSEEEVRAVWKENGKPAEHNQTVEFQAGQNVLVDFTVPGVTEKKAEPEKKPPTDKM